MTLPPFPNGRAGFPVPARGKQGLGNKCLLAWILDVNINGVCVLEVMNNILKEKPFASC